VLGAGFGVTGLGLLDPVPISTPHSRPPEKLPGRKEGGKEGRERHTMRFRSPTNIPDSVSRASSLWPTSSNASVASWPPTSRRTSSPPLGWISG
jgi:hypothetical protein